MAITIMGKRSNNGSVATLQKGEHLRTNLGIPKCVAAQLVVKGTPCRRLIDAISHLTVPLEIIVNRLVAGMPAWLRQLVIIRSLRFLVALHCILPSMVAKRGLADALSTESHALSTFLWWARLAPMTLRRFRSALHMLSFLHLPPQCLREETVEFPEQNVRGVYMHCATPCVEDPPVILYFFPGAFMGGGFKDNRGFVGRYCEKLQCDAFLADYRLCPEHTIQDAYEDGCRAYEWLLTRKAPEKIIIMGVSSGGGLGLRVCQMAATMDQTSGFRCHPVPQPAAAVLLGPFLNYCPGPNCDLDHSLNRNPEIDLVVTQRVYDFVQPRLAVACGGEDKKAAMSPLFNSVDGLCPILVSYSAHEVTADDCDQLVSNLRSKGVNAEGLVQPYQMHCFQLWPSFLPEAKQAESDICTWIQKQGGAWRCRAA
mmetsp:Transcript_17608/g.34332  ORF Transcript_17608/g.34332 Transcript_17608/m.34332 type:complete len:426 (-) Transcript_17608:100-1377(-)